MLFLYCTFVAPLEDHNIPKIEVKTLTSETYQETKSSQNEDRLTLLLGVLIVLTKINR